MVTALYRSSLAKTSSSQMSPDDRISRLLNALSGGLSQEKLESLSSEFNSLAQDRAETLVFFVLQEVTAKIDRKSPAYSKSTHLDAASSRNPPGARFCVDPVPAPGDERCSRLISLG